MTSQLLHAACRGLAVLFAVFMAAASVTTWGAGSASSGAADVSVQPRAARSPEQTADSLYKSGLRYKEKAWKQEEKAAEASTEAKREKYLAKAQKEYTKAIDKQSDALRAFPTHYKAANELGYALRKTGDFKKAIGAYNYALEIHPKYWEAVEYRGEAFLALGFTDHAKKAYMELFRADPELAAQLMSAMDAWLADQPKDSAPATDLAEWLAERKTLARMSQDLGQNNTRNW
jgi:tetratricopeptide (TPR) repeat protein